MANAKIISLIDHEIRALKGAVEAEVDSIFKIEAQLQMQIAELRERVKKLEEAGVAP